MAQLNINGVNYFGNRIKVMGDGKIVVDDVVQPPAEKPQALITHEEAAAIEKTLLSSENHGHSSIMGAHMIDTYKAADGRTVIYDWGNGWGQWAVEA